MSCHCGIIIQSITEIYGDANNFSVIFYVLCCDVHDVSELIMTHLLHQQTRQRVTLV